MTQTRRQSAREAGVNVAIGYGVATVANMAILPALGYPVTLAQSAWVAAVYVVLGFVRSYLVRRWFDG